MVNLKAFDVHVIDAHTLFLEYQGGLLYQWGILGVEAYKSLIKILHHGKDNNRAV